VKPATAATLRLLRIRGSDGVTAAEARTTIACDRLAARVAELRAQGYRIDTVPELTPMKARIARYVLVEPTRRPVTGDQQALAL